jgi:murein DD-endopeptidase MepM/ murein hydrolase activator NlpD
MSTIDDAIQTTPTKLMSTLMRGGPGAFGAPRDAGAKHQGVDLVANQNSMDKSTYEVYATASGKVAYARLNGTDETGYGYTVILDHQNDFYTQYSHLAVAPSQGLVAVGDEVNAGQVIGYLADLTVGEMSSGNVRADVVQPYDKIQLHFECFEEPTGRRSEAGIAPIKANYTLDDPTSRLTDLGYQSF